MRSDLLKSLERRVPRYTSYPTAVQFGPQVNAATYVAWLAELPKQAPISLYLHVPFCAELCLYCGCNTTAVRQYGPVEAYVALLEREIAAVSAITGDRRVTHLHWGGGTPTMLSPPDFRKLTDLLRRKFSFAADAEIAVEIDPRTVTHGHAAVLAELGITRASLGVQDFDERVQHAVGRVQSFELTKRVVAWFREAEIAGINLDLMYGLPYQTAATLTETIARAVELDPDRIALFGYAHVPWMKRHQRLIPETALPGTEERFAQSQTAAALLTGASYVAIGLDHFAKRNDLLARRQRDGRLHRNFQGYTTDESEDSHRLRHLGDRLAAPRLCAECRQRRLLPERDRRRHAGDIAWRRAHPRRQAAARCYLALNVRFAHRLGGNVRHARHGDRPLHGRTRTSRRACGKGLVNAPAL